MRVVSLVPSTTALVAELGRADDLVGVTDFCEVGAPATAARVGGTKNPDVARIVALRPDVVLANTEENRPADLDRLRAAGLEVAESFPRTVRDSAWLAAEVGERLGAREAGLALARAIRAAAEAAATSAPAVRVMALTLIWRRPWMAVGPDTYVDDLLWTCGFANVLAGFEDRYPRVDPSFVLGADVVLLPSEPYAFSTDDLPAVRGLVGEDPTLELVDGRLLTWHGAFTVEALQTFGALARRLAADR